MGSRTAFIPLAPPGTRQKGVDHAESYSNSRTYSDLCYDRNGQRSLLILRSQRKISSVI